MGNLKAVDHYDYPVLDSSCACSVCTDWRIKRDAYQAALAPVVAHNRSCRCAGCRSMRSLRTVYHASVNRRDLYSEMSWLVRNEPKGPDVMTWLLHSEMQRPDRGDGWWEGRAPYYPLAHFLSRGMTAITAMVTGVTGIVARPFEAMKIAV